VPFPMVHLSIARGILAANPGRFDPAAFYIGSLAPDSVHFRPDFTAAHKLDSHLVMDGQKWGEVTNNAAWENKVLNFFSENRNLYDPSFLCGYCGHILADIAWNRRFWMPFRAKNTVDLEHYNGDEMHRDCDEMDVILYHDEMDDIVYHQLPEREEIWTYLKSAAPVDIPGVVSKSETERMLHSLLYEQFANREVSPDYEFHHIDLARVQEFIRDESGTIKDKLLETGV